MQKLQLQSKHLSMSLIQDCRTSYIMITNGTFEKCNKQSYLSNPDYREEVELEEHQMDMLITYTPKRKC